MNKNKLMMFAVGLMALVVSYPASATITHRYPFDNGDPNDVVGGLESVLEEGAYVSGGALVLPAGDGSPDARLVMDGPATAINTYTSGVSFEAWFTPQGAGLTGWTRVFDFGGTEGDGGGNCLFYTPSGPGSSRFAVSSGGYPSWQIGEDQANGPTLALDTEYHVICTYEPTGKDGASDPAIRIFQDGVQVASKESLAIFNIADANNTFAFLGSATYPGDPEFEGLIEEFRLYDKPLDEGEAIYASHFGPDNPPDFKIRSVSPYYGKENLSPTPTVSWTIEPGVTPLGYDLYFGTDPNIADPNLQVPIADISRLVAAAGPSDTSYTVGSGDAFPHERTIYWRIDVIEAGPVTEQGAGRWFTIAPAAPVVDPVNPEMVAVPAGDDTDLTATTLNADEIKWYLVGDPDVECKDSDPNYTIVNDSGLSTLTIHSVQLGDEGYYYCEGSNLSGSDSSIDPETGEGAGRVMIERLTSQYLMEDVVDANTPDEIDGYPMHLTSTDPTSSLLPSLEPNITSGISGTTSLLLDNDGSTDPNYVFADILGDVADYVDITIAGWFYWNGGGVWQRAIDFGYTNASGWGEHTMFVTPDAGGATGLRFVISDFYWNNEKQINSSETLPANQWVHVTVTLEGDDGRMFVNGDQVAENIGGMTLDPIDLDKQHNYIGKSMYSTDPYFDGMVDDFRIYNHALSPVEVAILYTDVKTSEYVCIEDPLNPLTYDLNNDCRVSLDDIKDLALNWLDCERVPTAACSW